HCRDPQLILSLRTSGFGGGRRKREGSADASGQFFLKGHRSEAIGAVSNLAFAVQDDHRREGVDTEQAVEAIRKNHRGSSLGLRQVGSNQSFILIAVRGNKENLRSALKLRGHTREKWLQLMARPAPGGPEVHD